MEIEVWAEKYRPKKLSEVINQKHVVDRIKAFIEEKNIPHMLFAGPPGTGKTTVALCIAYELYGKNWRQNVLEKNASDERGIDVIRGAIKDFARTKAIGDVPYKLIILDECLDYNTEVIINKGNEIKRMKLGEVVEKNEHSKVLSVDENNRKTFVDVNRVIKIPHNPALGLFKLRIHDGREIIVTGNHLILTENGWKEVAKIKRKEKILATLPETIDSKEYNDKDRIIDFELKVLPRNIVFIERFLKKSPEIKILEILEKYKEGLTKREIAEISGISIYKLNHILSSNPTCYAPLLKLGIVERVRKKKTFVYKLKVRKEDGIELIKTYKREKFEDKNSIEYVTKKLKDLGLLPLRKEKAIILAKLLGHIFGDGSLSLKNRSLFFSGKEEDVKEIKSEIEKLGFHTSGKIKYKKWRNGEVWSITSFDKVFVSLMYSLGAPVGKKTDCIYHVPNWIMNGDKDIKREFLSSLFGSEGYKPMFEGRTVKPIVISQRKRVDLSKNLNEFLTEISNLLNEFGIKSKVKINLNDRVKRKDGTQTVKGYLIITNSMKNILNFLEKIGYEYCKYKEEIAKKAIQYLKWRIALKKNAYSFRPIPHFNEWMKKLVRGDCCYYYVDKVEKLKDVEYVYCLTTSNGKFVANGFIVHNCDALTPDAQNALRRTMESYTSVSRFILICNYSSKIIEPLQSRTAVFRFKLLSEADVRKFIERIVTNEKLKITEDGIKAIVEISEGDLRKVANLLQAAASLSKKITGDEIYDVASRAKPTDVKEMLELALKGKFEDARKKLQEMLLKQGLAGSDIISEIHRQIYSLPLPEEEKIKLVEKCGEYEFRISEGANELIQLEALLAQFMLAKK